MIREGLKELAGPKEPGVVQAAPPNGYMLSSGHLRMEPRVRTGVQFEVKRED
jgi:hypothetical protein